MAIKLRRIESTERVSMVGTVENNHISFELNSFMPKLHLEAVEVPFLVIINYHSVSGLYLTRDVNHVSAKSLRVKNV